MAFNHKHLIDITEYSADDIMTILETAKNFKQVNERRIKKVPTLKGFTVVNMFNEPSTRTRSSFEIAEKRLSADSLNFGGSSTATVKGESLVDTVKTLCSYKIDCIVVRDRWAGVPRKIADVSGVSVIDAGDGKHQHPTQALLDIYTIRKEKGHIGGQTITFLGDLKYGRTVHSLGYFMQQLGNKMIFASPDELKMPEEITAELRAKGADITETDDVKAALAVSDLVYVTRVQRERFPDEESYNRCKGSYIVNNELLKAAKKDITILHPLPRVDEIATEVDSYAGAAYFRQAHNGMYLRMALLGLITGRVQ